VNDPRRQGDEKRSPARSARIVALAYPDRIARARGDDSREYLTTGGTGVELTASSALRGAPWLAVADAVRGPGDRVARVRLAVPIDEESAREAAAGWWHDDAVVAWEDGDVVAERRERLGAIVLARRPLAHPDPPAVAAAVRDGLAAEGLDLLRWDDAATALRARLAFLHAARGDPWPAVDDEALLARLDEWLDLTRVRRRADLARVKVAPALRHLVPWSEAGRLDELAPTHVTTPDGRRVRVDYSDPAAPVVALRVQQAFGWERAPVLAGVPVVVHLLSPAGRPAAVTADLASFWDTGYPQVRAELRGRYPKHAWPEDPRRR
jgi:ATP-dependent helicase HrpB